MTSGFALRVRIQASSCATARPPRWWPPTSSGGPRRSVRTRQTQTQFATTLYLERQKLTDGAPPRSKLLAFACPACRTPIGVELVFDVPRMAHAVIAARLLPTSSQREQKMSLKGLMNSLLACDDHAGSIHSKPSK